MDLAQVGESSTDTLCELYLGALAQPSYVNLGMSADRGPCTSIPWKQRYQRFHGFLESITYDQSMSRNSSTPAASTNLTCSFSIS